ncbi:MAG TPA: glutamyl-tRNA reductase [Vicinamibacteria bacterium]
MTSLHLLGASHRTASAELRHDLALSLDEVRDTLRAGREERHLQEALVLSTCNRTELYAVASDGAAAEEALRALVRRAKGKDLLGPGPERYACHDGEAARHLLRVASGLESMVLGEAEILGQVRDALALAASEGALGSVLDRLVTTALRAGKRARTETDIGAGTVSVASAAVALAGKVFSDLGGREVLVLGAGDTARLAGQHFALRRPKALRIANRTVARAEALAQAFGGEAFPLDGLAAALVTSDVIVCATSAPRPLLGCEDVRDALRGRRGRPLLVIDLGVPRNVEPAVADLEGVFLHTVDAVRGHVDENLGRRRRAVPRVEAIVEEELFSFLDWVRTLEVTPTLRALRERFEAVRAEEVGRHLGRFSKEDAERVESLTRSLVNRLLHTPITRLKALGAENGHDRRRLDAVREIFDLEAAKGGRGEAGGA